MLSNLTVLTTSLTSSATPGQVSATATAPIHTSPSVQSSTVYETPSMDGEIHETFEGNSSMTAYTLFASKFLEQAVTSPSFNRKLSLDMENPLASLRQMVQLQGRQGVSHESKFSHQKPAPKGLGHLPLPPTDIVLRLLREIKSQ